MRRRSPIRVWASIALFVALAVAGAALYVVLAPRHYRATAQLLVVPVSDPRYEGLPVLRGATAVADAVQLARSTALADSVRQKLGLHESPAELLADVRARRAGASSAVDVTATSSTRAEAVEVANAFVDLLVAEQTATLNAAIIDATARTFNQLVRLPPRAKAGARGTALRSRLAALRSLNGSTNPSLRVVGHATRSETVRPPALAILLGTLGGAAVLGGAAGLLATRRRAAGEASTYDLSVTDRLVAQLEQRLTGRLDELLAEQERLAAKEAELAARARELGLGGEPGTSVSAGSAPATELGSRERTLEERIRLVTRRELELARRAAELARREQELDGRAGDLDGRARQLQEDAEELESRARELEQRAEELETRAAELEELTAAAAPPAPVPPVGFPEHAANVTALPQRPGRWNLNELARVVEERGVDFPERLDEWQSYLFFLRGYAEPDGTVPASFDWLIEEQFAGIVPATAS